MYPIPPYKRALASLAQVTQMGAIGLTFFSEQLRQMAGLTDEMMPQWYFQVQQNKIGFAAGIWFVGNMVNNQLVSTGAFEIYYNGQLVFSKLDEGRLPNAMEVFEGILQIKHGAQAGQISMDNQNILL
eukprot:TRINITY_DN19174_c0_g1_i1.p5 TRINITY_DN19174_c0_g1~~TRINITY_DN19174_c0_g1_i1.p5  ORF type:complete len:128 (-),score=17.43 TRINITY_DN19174_c0_g1_i1:1434-1817(-)